jgi:hypothetical protein
MAKFRWISRLAAVGTFALLLASSSPANAQPGTPGLKSEVDTGIEIAIPVVVGVTALVIYAVVHSSHTLEGCAVTASDGIELRQNDGQQSWALLGETASIKAGERVRLSGRRQKKTGGRPRGFVVSKLVKDKGPCP